MHKAPFVFPVIGGRKFEHLQDNIKALSISLIQKQIEFLENQAPFEPGFPHLMIVSPPFQTAPYNELTRCLSKALDSVSAGFLFRRPRLSLDSRLSHVHMINFYNPTAVNFISIVESEM